MVICTFSYIRSSKPAAMKPRLLIVCAALVLLRHATFAQVLDDATVTPKGNGLPGKPRLDKGAFTIGMFGAGSMRPFDGECEAPPATPWLLDGRATSSLNITAADGFTAWQTYVQGWYSRRQFLRMLGLSKQLDLRLLLSFHQYFEPATDLSNNYLGFGSNIYDGCGFDYAECEVPAQFGKERINVDQFLHSACADPDLSDALMGIQIAEEASSCHYYSSHDCIGSTGWNSLPGCWQLNVPCDQQCDCGQASGDFHKVLLPVMNVQRAQDHFKNLFSSYDAFDKRVSIMEAHHHHVISADATTQEGGRPADYIHLLDKRDVRDLFLEGSYYSFPTNWANQYYVEPPNLPGVPNSENSLCTSHYLSFLKSIDYANRFANQVHKVIDATGGGQDGNYDPRHFHSNPNIPNANWLWFQAYASILHGARGVWFWSHPWTFAPWETEKWNEWHTAEPQTDAYSRAGFPISYNNWVSPLAQELRYLSNNGFLSENSQIMANRDHGDDHNIISEYHFAFNIQNQFGSIYTHVSDFPANWIQDYRPLNRFGVKYAFHTNGDEVVMIVANPVNSPVQVFFDLSCVGDRRISESTSFEVLFSNQVGPQATWSTYKTNRQGGVDLETNQVLRSHTLGLDNLGELGLILGPMDVVVLKLNKKSQDIVHGNGWTREWTNQLSGALGGWNIQTWDKFFPGDFDGDGVDEILAVGNAGLATDWYGLLKFEQQQWTWLWSNYGNTHMLQPYHANFVVGDFDGDGRDELLGNDTWTTMFKWNGADWDWVWSDNGSSSHAIRPFKDRLYAGDFDGNGIDEILGCDLPNGWTTVFQYVNNNWVWGYWSDMGASTVIKPYRPWFEVGDFNGDGKDDLLGLNTWATLFSFNSGGWSWLWSTQGSNSFNGWNYPLHPVHDRVVVGNFDGDSKEELMFLSTGPYASWALCQDFNPVLPGWNFNWVANNTYSIPFIDDWPINDGAGSATRYLPVRTIPSEASRLLALRKFPCGGGGRFLASLYAPDGSNKHLDQVHIESGQIDNRGDHSAGVVIYPNPLALEPEFKILSFVDAIVAYSITDMTGRVVSSAEFIEPTYEATVPGLGDVSGGIYLVHIGHSSGQRSVSRLLYSP